MENDVLNDIIAYAIERLKAKYGYCGAAIGTYKAILNSDDDNGHDITINIKVDSNQNNRTKP